ncbi:MAG TPA: hypothetical protein VGM17_11655 [Rhizomicrobium sp.]|jgi:hypothetical protein
MLHLLALPFILIGVLMSGVMAFAGVALFAALLIPLLILALFFRVSIFFLKFGLIVMLVAVLFSWL